jgi:hypothetical protein
MWNIWCNCIAILLQRNDTENIDCSGMNFAAVILYLQGIFNGTGTSVGNSANMYDKILFAVVIISSRMKCVIIYL